MMVGLLENSEQRFGCHFIWIGGSLFGCTQKGLLRHSSAGWRPFFHHGLASRKRPAPYRVVDVILTHDCNFLCKYCWQRPIPVDKSAESVPGQVQSVLELVREAPSGEMTVIHFTGGEPLLRWPQLQSVAEEVAHECRVSDRRVALTITTNASLLDSEMARWCALRRIRLSVSLDGPPIAHDRARVWADGKPTSEHTIRGIRIWKAENPPESTLSLRSTVYRGTQDLVDIYRALAELRPAEVSLGFCLSGPDGWRICPDDARRFEEQWVGLCDEYLSQIKTGYVHSLQPMGSYLAWALVPGRDFTRCGVQAGNESAVLPDGSIASCYNLALVPPPAVPDDSDPCRRCWARNACGGSCPVDGTPNLLSCGLTRSLVERTARWVTQLDERDREVVVSTLTTA